MIFDAIHRLRHAAGFGVHSPLGFRMVKRVIRPGHQIAYYGYALIHSNHKRARLLLRLTAEIRPEKIYIRGALPASFVAAVKSGAPNAAFVNTPFDADLVISVDPDSPISDLYKLLKENPSWDNPKKDRSANIPPSRTLFILNHEPNEIRRLCQSLPSGIAFEAKDGAIILKRPDITPQLYTLPPF